MSLRQVSCAGFIFLLPYFLKYILTTVSTYLPTYHQPTYTVIYSTSKYLEGIVRDVHTSLEDTGQS